MTIKTYFTSNWCYFVSLIEYLICCIVGVYMMHYAIKEGISLLNIIIGTIGFTLTKPIVTINNKRIKDSIVGIHIKDNVQD